MRSDYFRGFRITTFELRLQVFLLLKIFHDLGFTSAEEYKKESDI